MQRQTPRRWVRRYNAEGVAALLDRPKPTRARLLRPEQSIAFDCRCRRGYDPRGGALQAVGDLVSG